MRIAVDANPLLWKKTTGVQNHARGICGALTELAPDDEFFLFYEESARNVDGFDDTFVRSLPANWQVVPGRVVGPTAAVARYFWEHWGLPGLVKRHGADVYYSSSTLGPFTRRCGVAITIHDLAKEARGVRRLPPRPVMRLARRAGRIFTVSQATASDVQRILGLPAGRMTTVYNAPAPGIAPASPAQQRDVCDKYDLRVGKFLLCVGDENWRRRYLALWEAMEAFWSGGHLEALVVAFVGRSNWRESDLYARVRAGVWRDGAVFLNNVSDPDLSALYSAARATVVPSEAEGFGMPVVEAMVCGSPVVCSDLPVLREVAGEAVLYFDLHRAGALSEAIRKIATDADLRADLVGRGLARGGRYTWRAAAETVYAALRQLADA